jgi:hypothetical protein
MAGGRKRSRQKKVVQTRRRGRQYSSKRTMESCAPKGVERLDILTVGLVTPESGPDAGQKKKTNAYDPRLDPQMGPLDSRHRVVIPLRGGPVQAYRDQDRERPRYRKHEECGVRVMSC